MPRFHSSILFAVLTLSLGVCAQDKPTMGVLDAALAGKGFDSDLRPVFTSLVRGKVVDLLHDSVDVMEGSKLERLLATNVKNCSNAECLVQFTRSIGVDYLLETRMLYRKGSWTATIKLASAKSASLVSEKTEDYEDEAAAKKGLPLLARQAVASLVKERVEDGSEERHLGGKKMIVSFSSEPPGAAVSVDGNISCASTPCKRPFPQGMHRLEMVKDGFSPRTESVDVASNGQSVHWELVPIRTRMVVDAVDDRNGDALIGDVYADGVKIGQTPFDELVAVSSSRIEVAPEGFERQSQNVILEDGKAASITMHFRSTEPRIVVNVPSSAEGSFTDSRDGRNYRIMQRGSQTWMAENLNRAMGNSWCYDNDAENCAKYGRLYDWETAMRACPEGWHLPSDIEWRSLARDDDQGDKASGAPLKSSSWDGKDEFGFDALPTGNRGYDGSFFSLGSYAYFWTGSVSSMQSAWGRNLSSGSRALGRYDYYKTDGFSVRCLKDSP